MEVSVEDFKERWVSSAASGIEEQPITDALAAARRFVKKNVAGAAYRILIADYSFELSADQTDTLGDLREAQHLMAHRAYLLTRGNRLKDGGIFKKEIDPNSQSTVEFESVSEIEKLRAAHLAEANELLLPYLAPVATVEIESSSSASVPLEIVLW